MEATEIRGYVEKKEDYGSIYYVPYIDMWCNDKYCPYALEEYHSELEAYKRLLREINKLIKENPRAKLSFIVGD